MIHVLVFLRLSVIILTAWLAGRRFRNPAFWIVLCLVPDLVVFVIDQTDAFLLVTTLLDGLLLFAVRQLPKGRPIERSHDSFDTRITPTLKTLAFWIGLAFTISVFGQAIGAALS